VVLACALLTYGGVSLFVVAFSVYPIAASLFREAAIPKRLIPAAIGLGSFTFTMVALPGTPAIQNAIPIPFFKTTIYAAPGMGLIAAAFMFAMGMLWLNHRTRAAARTGEGYGEHKDEPTATDTSNLPSFFIAVLPILLVIALNFLLSSYVIPAFDHSYLATAKFKNIELKKVLAIWAIVGAMAVAILAIVIQATVRLMGTTWPHVADLEIVELIGVHFSPAIYVCTRLKHAEIREDLAANPLATEASLEVQLICAKIAVYSVGAMSLSPVGA
jgi:H+/gluconate symporter-like permease